MIDIIIARSVWFAFSRDYLLLFSIQMIFLYLFMIILAASVLSIFIESCTFCWIIFIYAFCLRWYLYPCVCVCKWVSERAWVCEWVNKCVIEHAWVSERAWVCEWACMSVWVSVHECVSEWISEWLSMHECMYSCSFTRLVIFWILDSRPKHLHFVRSGESWKPLHSFLQYIDDYCCQSCIFLMFFSLLPWALIVSFKHSMHWLPSSQYFVCALCDYLSHLYSFYIKWSKHQYCILFSGCLFVVAH